MIKETLNYQAMVDAVRQKNVDNTIIIVNSEHPPQLHNSNFTHNVWMEETEKNADEDFDFTSLRNVGFAHISENGNWCFHFTPGVTLEGKNTLWVCKKEPSL